MVYGHAPSAGRPLLARPTYHGDMMRYVCGACAKDVNTEEIKKRIRCPYCGNKVLFKKRPDIIKKVKAL